MRWTTPSAALAGLLALAGPLPAQQMDNRERKEPGLILETGARTASCDALLFTRDGRHLLAAGDDKVVRIWPCGVNGLDVKNARVLRWSIWREQRGSIYALALDRDETRAAIAGFGARTGLVMVLDLASGKVLHALKDVKDNDQVIRALAFAPSGKRVAFGTESGSVWVWDLEKGSTEKLGESTAGADVNRVRFLEFTDEGTLASLAEDGKLLAWEVGRRGQRPRERYRVETGGGKVFRAAVSLDRKWLAAGVAGRGGSKVEVFSLETPVVSKVFALPDGQFVNCVGLDRGGQRLALAVGSVRRAGGFAEEAENEILICDLRGRTPRETARLGRRYSVDALAFHPERDCLTIAGGDNHEVTLWDLPANRPFGNPVLGAGRCLWSVALSADGKQLGIRDRRAAEPSSPNHRGIGPWRVFDLEKRRWSLGEQFQPVEPLTRAGGWTLLGGDDFATWYAVDSQGRRHRVPLDRTQDQYPRCWTFLEATATKPVRLAVGHYYGVSIFSLNRDGLRRERLFTGHQDYVMALAPSADGQWLVSASRDQTVAAWSLEEWPSHPELGAGFTRQGKRVLVTQVDAGSPAWEAGLAVGDEIVRFQFDAQEFLYDPEKQISDFHARFTAVGGPEECMLRLRQPVPGKEFMFWLRRAGKDLDPMLTTVRQRPQWQFLPGAEREWILWLSRSYYYDTSTYGDYLIGWHVNDRFLDREPVFYRAEQFRHRFQRPDLVEQLLWARSTEAGLRNILGIEPPAVAVTPEREAVLNADTLRVNVTAHAQDATKPDQGLHEVQLWIEDHLFKTWNVKGTKFADTVTVPRGRLRSGVNQLTLQCVNQANVRGEAVAVVRAPQRAEPPRLFGLMVGVDDYSNAVLPKNFPRKLQYAGADARALRDLWLGQRGKLYPSPDVQLLGPDTTSEAILEWLRDLAERVRPDDRVVLFLGGHGDVDPAQRGGFVFCPPTYDRRAPGTTGLGSGELYRELAKLGCQKLVLLDVCRSGLAVSPVRSLTPGGKGPRILASCDRDEEALEGGKFKHGLFVFAVLESLGSDFAKADRNQDGRLDAAEMFTYAEQRMPALLKQIGRSPGVQNPTRFPPTPDAVPFAGR